MSTIVSQYCPRCESKQNIIIAEFLSWHHCSVCTHIFLPVVTEIKDEVSTHETKPCCTECGSEKFLTDSCMPFNECADCGYMYVPKMLNIRGRKVNAMDVAMALSGLLFLILLVLIFLT